MKKSTKFLIVLLIIFGAVRGVVSIVAPVGYVMFKYPGLIERYFGSKDTSGVSFVYRGVNIRTYPDKKMFPDSWWESPINGKTESLLKRNEQRALDCVRRALDKYPEEFLARHLSKIYVLGDISFYGLGYGGTYYEDKVFLDVKDNSLGYTDDYIEKSVHHEFSSILYMKYPLEFNLSGWMNANPKDFKYGSGGVDAIRNNNASLEFDEECNSLGFLNEYSKASAEEDFNEIAGNMFLSTKKFWDIVEKNERVKTKVKIAIELYNKLEPRYTEDYFRNLRK